MKLKFIAVVAAGMAAFTGLSNGVTLTVLGIANDSLGRATLGGANISGRAIFVSTTDNLALTAGAALTPLLNGPTSVADFDTALGGLIGATDATTPGILTEFVVTDGLITLNQAFDVGNAGNFGTLYITAEAGGNVVGMGAYSGPVAPAAGAMVFNPLTMNDTIGIGTSVDGFQLATVIPEPSAALLGLIGFLGLLRRRR